MFTYRVMRDEWVAQVGHIDCYGNPNSFEPYWTSEPFPTRDEAIAALESHEEVKQWAEDLGRYLMEKSYTHGRATFRRTEMDVYEGE